MLPGYTRDRIFNDPTPSRISIREDIPLTTWLTFKFHFLLPLISAIGCFALLIICLTDLPFDTQTIDVKILILLMTFQCLCGVLVFTRLTNFYVLREIFIVIKEKS